MAYLFKTNVDFVQNQLVSPVIHSGAVFPLLPIGGQLFHFTTDGNIYSYNAVLPAWVNMGQVLTNPILLQGNIGNPALFNPVAPTIGHAYIADFAGVLALIPGTPSVQVGDMAIYTASGWIVQQSNLVQATETQAGFAEIATQVETNTGTDDLRIVTPLKLTTFLGTYTRKFSQVINTVAAVPLTVTHNLNNTTPIVMTWQSGAIIGTDVATVSANAISITTTASEANITVMVIG